MTLIIWCALRAGLFVYNYNNYYIIENIISVPHLYNNYSWFEIWSVWLFAWLQGFLGLKWAKWKRVLLTRSISMVPCVIIAIIASKRLNFLDDFINIEQSLLVRYIDLQKILIILLCLFLASFFCSTNFVCYKFKENNETAS